MIRVLIAEDQSMVRGALAALLSLEPDIDVIGQAADGREALDHIEQGEAPPDVVLTDIEMPRMTGLESAQALHQGGGRPRVIIVTTSSVLRIASRPRVPRGRKGGSDAFVSAWRGVAWWRGSR